MKYTIFALLLTMLLSSPALAVGDIHEQEVPYESNGLVMNGYLAYDRNITGKRPGILVVHEWWGHNPYARKRARMLADLGYVAFAVDMYGQGKQAAHPEDAGKFAKQVMSQSGLARQRFQAAVNVLKNQPLTDPERIAAIGYCFGGGVVLHMARMGADIDGVVSFHGSLATQVPAQPGNVKAKILVCNGGEDPFVKPEQIEAFKKEMAAAGADMTFISYPGAKHSFTNPDADAFGKKFDLPLAYNATADQASWSEMQMFFKRIFNLK